MELLVLLIFIAVGCILFYFARRRNKMQASYIYIKQPLPSDFNTINTILIFDLHRVIFLRDFKKTFAVLLKPVNGLPFIFRFAKPKILKYALSLSRREGSDEEFLLFLTQYYPQLLAYKGQIKDLVSAYYPVKELITLIELLRKKGYSVHIASNIGATFLDGLTLQYPHIFSLFDVIKTVQNKQDGTPPVVKPNLAYFQEYIDQFNPNGKHMIFIDNNIKNLEACSQAGLIGIRFESSNQLEKILKNLTIL